MIIMPLLQRQKTKRMDKTRQLDLDSPTQKQYNPL